jgi:NaMN:DMB phosphoribosyltransferase
MIKELLILGAVLILNTGFACVMVSAIQQRNINQVVTAMLHVEVCRHEGMRRIPCPR